MTLELNIFNICKQPGDDDDVQEVNLIQTLVQNKFDLSSFSDPLEACLVHGINFDDDSVLASMNFLLKSTPIMDTDKWRTRFEELPPHDVVSLPSSVQTPKLDLKPLPADLKYAFLGQAETLPVVISSRLDEIQEKKLIGVLIEHKEAIGWIIADIKGISPLICTHRIYLEDNSKPSREMQRRLNPNMKEVVRVEQMG
ncbi:hypothetical protein I3843_09G167200 [Carya illinoinensis]|nr:hypothetical protein I3843_09G167200 [Carya illinoinensis]